MDWFTQGVITGIVSNVLTGLAPQIGGTPEAQTKSQKIAAALDKDADLTAVFRRAAIEAASALSIDKRLSEKLRTFLISPEAQSIIRQVYSLRLTTAKTSTLDEIHQVFHQSLSLYIEKISSTSSDFSTAIFDAVIAACNRALEVAIDEGLLAAQSAASSYK